MSKLPKRKSVKTQDMRDAAVALLLLLRALGDYKKRWRYVGLFYRFNAESHRFRFDLGVVIFSFNEILLNTER